MRAYLGLGSNLGDREALLRMAVEALGEAGVEVVGRSSVYETDPVGGPEQPAFLNQVIAVECDLEPRDLLSLCQRIERDLGRLRSPDEEQWGPRPIDLDILVAGEHEVREPLLEIPHPRIAERAFVLVPLAELAPDLEVPGRGRIRDLLGALGEVGGVRRHDPTPSARA